MEVLIHLLNSLHAPCNEKHIHSIPRDFLSTPKKFKASISSLKMYGQKKFLFHRYIINF